MSQARQTGDASIARLVMSSGLWSVFVMLLDKGAARGVRRQDKSVVVSAQVVAASPAAGANPPALRRVDAATLLDWEFVRPAGRGTDTGAVLLPRTCASCGGPYRSEFDDACPYCHASRADSQAGWRLDRNYLVVDAGGR